MYEKFDDPSGPRINGNGTENAEKAPRAPIARYILTAGGITALGLLLIEAFLRLFVFGPGPAYVFDPQLGKRYASGTGVFWGIEGHGRTRYISDDEIATPFVGKARTGIVVMGDSYTEAYQVNDDRKFASIAETTLRRNGFDVDLHNLGRSGASLADYVYMAGRVRKQYSPGVIVVQISRQDFETGDSFDIHRSSHFVMTGKRSLEIRHRNPVDDSRNIVFRRIKQSSALVNYGFYRLMEIRKGYLQHHKPPGSPDGGAPAGENGQLSPAESQKLQLEALAGAYRGIPVVVLVLPYTPFIETGRLIQEEQGFAEMLAVARSVDGLTVVEPTSGFLALSAQNKLPRGFLNTPPGIGHLNREGHEIAGAALAQALEELVR